MADLNIGVVDSFALAEAALLAVTTAAVDAFTASDASGPTPAVAPLVSDTATLTEAISGRTLGLYDGAVLTDAATRNQLLAGVDTATLSESAALAVVWGRSDAFVMADAAPDEYRAVVVAQLTRTDSIALAESTTQPPATFARTDDFAFSEVGGLLALWSVSDSAGVSDLSGGRVGLAVSDVLLFSDFGRRVNAGPVPLLRDPLRAVLVSNGRAGVRVLNPSEAAAVSNGKTDATPPD